MATTIDVPKGTVSESASTAVNVPAGPRTSRTRWLGYEVYQAAKVAEFSAYTNLMWTHPQHEGPLIEVSRNAGLKVVLSFEVEASEPLEEATNKLLASARRYGDAVSAICWQVPYEKGRRPSDLSNFAQKLKQALPNVEFWCTFLPKTKGIVQPLPVPPEVDVITLELSLTNPAAVSAELDEVLPEWLRKAAGRPVLLVWWNGGTKNPQGLVPACQPGTFRAYAQVVERYGLRGVLFADYGRGFKDVLGIETSSVLISEIKQIAKDWGIGTEEPAGGPSPDAAAGFESLFNGRDLSGWLPFRSWGPQPEQGGGDWIARNGELVCDGDETAWLRSDRQFADFLLQLEFKIPADANSGILVRCPEDAFPAMEIQLAGTSVLAEHATEPTWQTGAIFGAVGPTASVQRGPSEWNTMEIRCQGDDIEVRMNGTLIVQANMQREEKLRDLPRSGFVGFLNATSSAQGTARGMALRSIRIRELKPSD